MTKSNADIAMVWLMKVKRLIAMKDFNQAHSNLGHLIKFAGQHDYSQVKLECELLHSQIYIELGDFSQAMIQVTKTIASLEKHKGDMSRLNALAQLKLSEIQMSLEPYIYDSFKRLNSMMPRIMENGSKDV